jgi:hypothetical protein
MSREVIDRSGISRYYLHILAAQEPHMLKTEKKAREYANTIKAMTGKTHLVFKVPAGTAAYAMGQRFATCEDTERSEYEAGGAVFVDSK